MSAENLAIDPKEIAEDYRRQRQAAQAAKTGFPPMGKGHFLNWLAENDARLVAIAKANGADDDEARKLVDDYRRLMEEAPSGSDHDNPSFQTILGSLVGDIEKVCRTGNVPLGDGVVVGSIPKLGIDAYQMPADN
jgi:hypothetical protein